MYFIEDIKNNENVYSIENNKIVFNDGTTYTFSASPDSGIYRNKVKICSNILNCKFSKSEENIQNKIKRVIEVKIVIKGSNIQEVTTQYVLKYW